MVLKEWRGRKLTEFWSEHEFDTRKFYYYIIGRWDGKEQHTSFTSDDVVDGMWPFRLLSSKIGKVELIKNEWHITVGCYV